MAAAAAAVSAPLDKRRFGRVTGSTIGWILREPGAYWGPDQAAAAIFGVPIPVTPEQQALFDEGHVREPELASVFQRNHSSSLRTYIPDPAFFIHPDYPFLSCTVDYFADAFYLTPRSEDCIVEMKSVVGRQRDKPVVMTEFPAMHYAQCQLQLQCVTTCESHRHRRTCWLVKGSDVNTEWKKTAIDQDWWNQAIVKLKAFYNRCLAWYWEGDESRNGEMRRILEFIKNNSDPKIDIDVDAILKLRPTEAEMERMRTWHREQTPWQTKRSTVVEEEAKFAELDSGRKRKADEVDLTLDDCYDPPSGSGRQTKRAKQEQPPKGLLLSDEQERIVKTALGGSSVFFTGCAGTGKSKVQHRNIELLEPTYTGVVAVYGSAAVNLGGETFHHWAGLHPQSVEKQPRSEARRIAKSKPEAYKNWTQARTLVIDEVGVIGAKFLAFIDELARILRMDDRPFGGIQIVASGDFLQLEPIKDQPAFLAAGDLWNRIFGKNQFELTRVYRQDDAAFVKVLNELRIGKPSEESIALLTKKKNLGSMRVWLGHHRLQVAKINTRQLTALTTPAKAYESTDVYAEGSRDASVEKLLDERAPQCLTLKVGAQCILTVNLDVASGNANGTAVQVIDIMDDGSVRVKKRDGSTLVVTKYDFSIERKGQRIATRSQLPLILGWAITVHRSQGMSLDNVEYDMTGAFGAGSVYTACSRARRLDGLEVKNFRADLIQTSAAALKFHQDLSAMNRSESGRA